MVVFPSPIGLAVPLWGASLLTVEFLLTVGLLVLALLGGAVILHYTDTWRKRQMLTSGNSAESLESFREMYERGEITEAEYQVVRQRIAQQASPEVAMRNPDPSVSRPNIGGSASGVNSAGPVVEPPAKPGPK